jgi:hypothetical protein
MRQLRLTRPRGSDTIREQFKLSKNQRRGRKVDVGVCGEEVVVQLGGGEVLEEGAVRRRAQVTVAIEHCTVRPCFVADVSST